MDDFDSDDFNDQYDDDYDYDSDEYIQHHGGYDDLYDDVQDDYGYDAWDLEVDLELPSKFRDYHPTWKKSKKTFLDLYFVAERTKEFMEFSREYSNDHPCLKFEEFATSYEDILKHLAVSKKKSIAILSKVLGLPDLVIDKIFINIVESYNWHFDKFGPEEMPWRYEEVDEDDPESPGEDDDSKSPGEDDDSEGPGEDDDKYPEFYYNMISDIYETIETILIGQVQEQELSFNELEISDSVSGDD